MKRSLRRRYSPACEVGPGSAELLGIGANAREAVKIVKVQPWRTPGRMGAERSDSDGGNWGEPAARQSGESCTGTRRPI